jgi:hypothetical protein
VFRLAIVVSLLLHVPFVPSNLSSWLRVLMTHGAADYDDPDAQAIIPIDLDLEATPNPTAVAAIAPAPAEPPPAPAEAAGKSPGEGPTDAGAPAPADAGASDAAAPKRRAPRDAGAEGDGGAEEKPPPLRDPIAAAGGAGKIAAKDPNVQILFTGKLLRKHELGAQFTQLFKIIPEWRSFFEGSPLDPIRDVDHLLITSPRFRGDTGKMVAVMQLNVPAEKVKEAVDQMIQSHGGDWLEDTPVPAARARVGRADRIFALVPAKRMLVVLPTEAEGQLETLKRAKGFSNGTSAVVISMLTPSRPFKPYFALPESLKWMRLSATLTKDGGAEVAIEAGDLSADEAAKHAPEITKEFEQRRRINVLGVTSMEVVGATTFTAEGSVIKARLRVTPGELRMIMGFVEQRARESADAGARPQTP